MAKSDFLEQLDRDLENVFYSDFTEKDDGDVDTVTYTYKSGASHTIEAIFDEEWDSMDLETEARVITSEPRFHAYLKQFTEVPGEGDSCLIRGRQFKVKEVHPDGTGVVEFTLLRK